MDEPTYTIEFHVTRTAYPQLPFPTEGDACYHMTLQRKEAEPEVLRECRDWIARFLKSAIDDGLDYAFFIERERLEQEKRQASDGG